MNYGMSVNCKENEVYIWLAIDRDTRQILGVYFGDRSRKSAQELWNSLPEEYKKNGTFYTDFWESYKKVIPVDAKRLLFEMNNINLVIKALAKPII